MNSSNVEVPKASETGREKATYSLWQMVQYMASSARSASAARRPGRLHAPRPGRGAEMDLRAGLQGGADALAAHARAARGAARDLSGLRPLRHRGATLVGIAFVLPSFLMVVAGLGLQGVRGLTWMQAVFYGVGAASSASSRSARTSSPREASARTAAVGHLFRHRAVTIVTESEFVWLFLAAGCWSGLSGPRRTGWRRPGNTAWLRCVPASVDAAAARQRTGRSGADPVFFTKAGAFVFGSGLAIVPFLYGGVVKEYGWLNERQFLDAVAVAMITPGPVVITVGFIGYLVAGFPGAAVAAIATFLPCYLFTIIPAPYFKKHGKRPGIVAFVDGVTAAAIGAIAGAVIVLGKRSIVDLPTVAILAVTVVLLWKVKKVNEPINVALAAVVGLIVYPMVKP